MRVRDVMTSKVFTIRSDKKVFIAEEIMNWAHIRHVPVVDAVGRVIGIVSHRDVLRASVSQIASHRTAFECKQTLVSIPVVEIMHEPAQTIRPDASVQEAAHRMRESKIGCLPVVDDGKLVGILTAHDILAIVEHLPTSALD